MSTESLNIITTASLGMAGLFGILVWNAPGLARCIAIRLIVRARAKQQATDLYRKVHGNGMRHARKRESIQAPAKRGHGSASIAIGGVNVE